jgi:hypothetical protein
LTQQLALCCHASDPVHQINGHDTVDPEIGAQPSTAARTTYAFVKPLKPPDQAARCMLDCQA